MKHVIAAVLCLPLPLSGFADSAGYRVIYDGGSPAAKAGTSLYLYIDSGLIRLAEQKGVVLASIAVTVVAATIAVSRDVPLLQSRVDRRKDRMYNLSSLIACGSRRTSYRGRRGRYRELLHEQSDSDHDDRG
jgi:hypothetical protein